MRGWAVLAAAMLCSCGSSARLETAAAPATDETVFVIGVAPDAVLLGFGQGAVRDGAFQRDLASNFSFRGKPQAGYIVARVKSGPPLGLVMLDWPARAVMVNALFWACGGRQTLVFDTPPDRVVYLGHIELEGSAKRITWRDGFERARGYVDENYPALRGRLSPHAVSILPTSTGCMPIQMPSHPLTFERGS